MTSSPLNLRVILDPEGGISQQRPPRGRCNLKVPANVAGAQVSVNNTPMGTAPASMKVDRGNYLVRVSAPGYQDYLTAVSAAGPKLRAGAGVQLENALGRKRALSHIAITSGSNRRNSFLTTS
jgi:hypothetical protein